MMEDKDAVCVWEQIPIEDWGAGYYFKTECGRKWNEIVVAFPFCPFCSRRINILHEPKEEKK